MFFCVFQVCLFSPIFFEIGRLPLIFLRSDNELCPISEKSSGRRPNSKKVKRTPKKQQKLWSDSCGARLAPGLKPLRLPRARIGR